MRNNFRDSTVDLNNDFENEGQRARKYSLKDPLALHVTSGWGSLGGYFPACWPSFFKSSSKSVAESLKLCHVNLVRYLFWTAVKEMTQLQAPCEYNNLIAKKFVLWPNYKLGPSLETIWVIHTIIFYLQDKLDLLLVKSWLCHCISEAKAPY